MKTIKKILIIPDSFKGSLDSLSAARAIKMGLLKFNKKFSIAIIPFSDGGDGYIDALNYVLKGQIIKKKVTSPLANRKVLAKYLVHKKTAIIEMAQASGLNLLKPSQYAPLKTTTYGTGELIKHAVFDRHIRKIILGLGGSATVDAGTGILSGLGIKFVTARGKEIHPGGGYLNQIKEIKITGEFIKYENVQFVIASDVTNPLTGRSGAARVYAPQKGASPMQVKLLENNINYFAGFIKKKFNRDISKFSGGGAAGGIAAGLKAFFDNVEIRSGAELLFELTCLAEKIKDYDVIITGEGRMDSQSFDGKAVRKITDLAKKHGKKVIAICGNLGKGYEKMFKCGIDHMESIIEYPISQEQAMKNADILLQRTAFRIARIL